MAGRPKRHRKTDEDVGQTDHRQAGRFEEMGGVAAAAGQRQAHSKDSCLREQPLRRAWAVDCEVILGFVDQEQVENRNWKLEREKKKIRPSTASNDTAPTR